MLKKQGDRFPLRSGGAAQERLIVIDQPLFCCMVRAMESAATGEGKIGDNS